MPHESVIASDPEILGGTPCFRGTRVPVDSLIDYLEAGDSLDEFLDNFPSVSREAAIAALEEAKALIRNLLDCWIKDLRRRSAEGSSTLANGAGK